MMYPLAHVERFSGSFAHFLLHRFLLAIGTLLGYIGTALRQRNGRQSPDFPKLAQRNSRGFGGYSLPTEISDHSDQFVHRVLDG